jgi:hypothetical protein
LRARKVAGLLGFLAACGPVEYLSQVTRRAADEVAAAKMADAEKYAPYEYTSAVEYLHKAREEEGYADHQAAIRFGKRAAEMAVAARQKALAEAGRAPAETAPAGVPPGTVIEAPTEPDAKPKARPK